MNIPDFPPEASKLGASFTGSLIALKWLPGGCWLKLHMLMAGTALSWYATEPLARWANMNTGTTGFFLGVFGMSIVSKVFEVIDKVQLVDMLTELARKAAGLPPKVPTTPKE